MEVVYLSHLDEQIKKEPHIMAIGFFDGVHLGHQELLNHAKKLAYKNNALFTAMTFSPHPDEVIKGDKDRRYLMSLPQKIKRMAAMGVDKLFVMKFDRTFASLPPTDFIKNYIVGLNVRHVVVGFDFTFGFKAKGNTELLRKQSHKSKQFGLSVIPKKSYMQEKISSTRIKELIQDGKVDLVPYYLGTHYEMSVNIFQYGINGNIVIQPYNKSILPAAGSYFVDVIQKGKTLQGVFHRYSELSFNHQLELNEPLYKLDDVDSIVFLSKVKTERSVLV
ncbi:hypothetical protein DTX80_12990 [Bacilli bacterium]|nr:hypothetical protein DEJ64_12610 [Bacilli bacterium]PZD85080.1 hypothetical protein DEJ60_13255 [Bacilli bacterium]PZD88580.1 hypothetical protein DEJ66_12740 [Bacilli bacterium]RCO05178.1 hypothetical protein DTX80_12990 [Bacilli bacterium]RCO07906.1 hypothetical protein DTX79_18000 [Bacilli bacterium]